MPDTLNQTQELFQMLLSQFPTDGSAQDCSIIFHRDQLKKRPDPKNSKSEDCANYLPTMLRNIGLKTKADDIESQFLFANKKKKTSKNRFLEALLAGNESVDIRLIGSYYIEVFYKATSSSDTLINGTDNAFPPQWFRNICSYIFLFRKNPEEEISLIDNGGDDEEGNGIDIDGGDIEKDDNMNDDCGNDPNHLDNLDDGDDGDDGGSGDDGGLLHSPDEQIIMSPLVKSPNGIHLSSIDQRCAIEGTSPEDTFGIAEEEESVANVEPSQAPQMQLLQEETALATVGDLLLPSPKGGGAIKTPSGKTAQVLKQLYPKKSGATIAATPKKGFQFNVRSTTKLKREKTRLEASRVTAILHSAAYQDFNSAKQILASVVKGIDGMSEGLSIELRKKSDTITTENAIVMSLDQTLQDLNARGRRTKENQNLQDSILFGVLYHLPTSCIPAVAKIFSLNKHTIAKISKQCNEVRLNALTQHEGNLMYFPLYKKKRKDAHSENGAIECVLAYCHSDENGTRIESNLNAIKIWLNDKGHPCKKSLRASDESFEFHPGRTWDGVVNSNEKYEDFCASEEYLCWRSRQNNPATASIGKSSFMASICPCVKEPRNEDCADVYMSALSHTMRAIKKGCIINNFWRCDCIGYHSTFATHMEERAQRLESINETRERMRDTSISVSNPVTRAEEEVPLSVALESSSSMTSMTAASSLTPSSSTSAATMPSSIAAPASSAIPASSATSALPAPESAIANHSREEMESGQGGNEENLNDDEEDLLAGLQMEDSPLPLNKMVRSTAKSLVEHSCCSRVLKPKLQCSVGYGKATIRTPSFIPFACVTSSKKKVAGKVTTKPNCDKCGIEKLLKIVEKCPLFNDDVKLIDVMVWEKVEIHGSTQDELRPQRMTMQGLVKHLKKTLGVARFHVMDYEWKDHGRKLDCKLSNPKNTILFGTDFSATANLQASERDNSAMDSHAIIAVYLIYHNWRTVLYATMSDDDGKNIINLDTSDDEIREMSEDWVMVDGGECKVCECDCVQFIGESETKSKDNNHQFHNACFDDLVEDYDDRRKIRETLSSTDSWVSANIEEKDGKLLISLHQ